MLCERLLIGAEQRHGERPRLAQELVERRLARDRDTDERRLEREGREGRDGQADPLTAGIDADDGDAARMAAEDSANRVGRDHERTLRPGVVRSVRR
jgi:hypothetical protein